MADLGGAMILVSAVGLLSLAFGVVLFRVFHGWFVDQTVSCGEAMALLAGTLGALTLTILAWGTPFMVVPPLLAASASTAWIRWQRIAERRAEAQHWLEEEARARRLLERDPNAAVGFDRLATALEHQGRTEEMTIALSEWLHREPWNPEVVARLNRLRSPQQERLRPQPKPSEAVEARPARDLGAVDLDSLLGHAPVAPPKMLSEEELLSAFSPDNEPSRREPDVGLAFNPDASESDDPGFGGTGVDPELRSGPADVEAGPG
ncbi:MAG: hypothetical protein HZB16_17450 [Armatimonadetes bacterium]|nr:hypothetical protein [Armatimonadota bacterium]